MQLCAAVVDYTFYSWKSNEEKLIIKILQELDSLGYEHIETKSENLDEFLILKNKLGETKTLKICHRA